MYTTDNLYLRSSPNVNSNIIAIAPIGSKVLVDSILAGGEWALVDYNNMVGYMNMMFLADEIPSSKFYNALSFTLSWEGGYVNDKKDPGGETNYGISKRAYPNLDIRNLSIEIAREIYYKDYWLQGMCDKMEWRLAMSHFDCAVNTGISRATQILVASDKDVMLYNSLRLQFYVQLSNFKLYGSAWTRRTAELMEYITK